MNSTWGDWLRYLRPHRVIGAISALAALAVVTAAWGATAIQMPSGNTKGTSDIPLWVLLPVAYAAAVALSLHSAMRQQEQSASRPFPLIELLHTITATLVAIGFLAAGLLAANATGMLSGAIRNLILAIGLALLGGRLMTRPLSWALPLAAIFPIAWFGVDALNIAYPWAIPLLPPTNTISWIAATTSYTIGLLAITASPWHLQRLRPWWQTRVSRSADLDDRPHKPTRQPAA